VLHLGHSKQNGKTSLGSDTHDLPPYPLPSVDAAVTFDKTLNPPSGIICYVDPASGVVIGIDDGTGPRCGTAGAHEVIIPLLGKQFVSRVDVGVVPKTDLIGEREFCFFLVWGGGS
jgi:hypothetical protein